jgi:hypothetical protein
VAKRKPKPTAAVSMPGARDRSLFARVIFYNADLGMISPAVSQYWGRPATELVRESGAMFTTNIPDAACARFIGWYLAQPGSDDFHLGVDNLPVPVWQPSADDAAPPAGWLDRLLAEVNGWDPPAVLARLDTLEITQGGRMLWRSA